MRIHTNSEDPIIKAAGSGDATFVTQLLEQGSSVNERTASGLTPLMAAVIGGHVDVVRVLLASGANPNLRREPDNNMYNEWSALLDACHAGHSAEIVTLLLQAGADIEVRDQSGYSPLMWAADMAMVNGEREEIVQRLIAAGADVNSRRLDGESVLSVALNAGNMDVVALLMAAGAQK
jgi:ankyrin repeat protein